MKLPRSRINFPALLSTHYRINVILLFCLFIAIYSMTYNGVFRVDDEHILAARAQSLALWGKLEEPQVSGNTRVQALRTFGDPATQIEPAISLIGVIPYKAGHLLNHAGMQALLTTNIYVTSLSVVAVYLLVRALKLDHRTAFWSATAFGLSSMAWPYAMTFLRDSLVMLMAALVLIGLAIALYEDQHSKKWGILLMALGIIGGSLSKNSMLAMIPALMMGLLYEAGRKARWREIYQSVGLGLLLLLVVVYLVPTTGPLARFSWSYYRSLMTHFLEQLKPSTLAGVLGPFISPSKSIFLFTPVLILIPWKLKRAWHRAPGWSITALTLPIFLALAQALFYGEDWAGTFGWGLRFMLPTLPGLFGLLAFHLDERSETSSPNRLFSTLFVIGVFIQVSASVTDWVLPYAKLQEMGLDPFDPRSAWSLRSLSIPFQLAGLLDLDVWNIAWLRTAIQKPSVFLLPLITLSLITATLLITRRVQKKSSPLIHTGLVAVMIASVLWPMIQTATLLGDDPYWEKNVTAYQEGLSYLQTEIAREDIVVVDAYGTPLWYVMMNQWDRPNPWTSFPYELLSPSFELESESSVFDLSSVYLPEGIYPGGTVWYIGSEKVPDFLSRDELRWLEQNYLECSRRAFERGVFVEVIGFNQRSCK